MSTIHFIGGEKGGVGKSVVARLTAQYCIDRAIPFIATDADGSNRTLMRFYGEYCRPIDLGSQESVDEILGLAMVGDRRVLVDLPAQSERVLADWIAEAGIFDLARECGVQIVFWHVMDDGKDSLTALDRVIGRYGTAARYVIVRNQVHGKDYALFDASDTRTRALALGAAIIDIPALADTAMRKIDRFDASYWAAAHNDSLGTEGFTKMDRQRIKVWLDATFRQIAQLGDGF